MHLYVYVFGAQTYVSVFVCERYGRRFVLLLSITLQTVFGVAVAFAPNFPVYVILRFVVGTSISGIIINAFVLGTCKTQKLIQAVVTFPTANEMEKKAWIKKLKKQQHYVFFSLTLSFVIFIEYY